MTQTTMPTTASVRSTRIRRAWIVVGLLVVFMLILVDKNRDITIIRKRVNAFADKVEETA